MSDIVERLRKRADGRTTGTHFNLLLDAAEAVERLRDELASARAAAFEEAATLIDEGFDRGIKRKQDTCAHGKFGWEDCEKCASAAIRSRAQEER